MFVVAAQLAYLLLVNAALRLPITQALVNEIRPEKFHVSWERAWTWYPFRLHAEGISANGQTRTQQWQLHSPSASGSIAILPLLLKRVWLSGVVAKDIDYRQRPRLKPGIDYAPVLPFFPDIEGRQIVAVEARPRPDRRPWHLAIDGIRASGQHQLWIYQARGWLTGEAEADLRYRSRGGPFSLDARELDLRVERLYFNGDREVFRRGELQGRVGFAPFVPRDNKGLALLGFLQLDVDVDLDVDSLAFLNLFTRGFEGLTVAGRGEIEGRLRYDRGTVLGGTSVQVDADDLSVGLMEHRIEGEGLVTLELGEATGQQLDLTFEYRDLQVFQPLESRPVLLGQDLELTVGGDGFVLPRGQRPDRDRHFGFAVEGLTVADLALLQRYLPAKWPFQLHGGAGELRGAASLTPGSLALELRVNSNEADVAIKDYRFHSDLDAVLKLDNPAVNSRQTSVAGSYLELSHARLDKAGSEDGQDWNAWLLIESGQFGLIDEAQKARDDEVIDLLQLLADSGAKQLVAQSSGVLEFTAEVSRLDWLGLFLEGNYGTAVSGSGKLGGELHLAAGLPAVGTDVQIRSADLAMDVLDYSSSGEGEIRLRVREGGEYPDWEFDLQLDRAGLRRRQDAATVIEDVSLELSAVIADVSFSRQQHQYALGFDIHSATITDMSVFNGYLPADAPLQLSGGTGELAAAIQLHPDDASGWVRLQAVGVEAEVGSQSIRGDLEADIRLAGGVPADMQFDISGSELLLDRVTVSGEKEQFSGDYWSGRVKLTEATTQWRKPLQLNARLQLLLSDSRPLVAMFDNLKWRPPFLASMLTVKDIEGWATVAAARDVIVIPYAHATSDNIELGARGSIGASSRDGVIYLRYRKADALLKINDGEKNVDVIGARKKYDAYRVSSPASSPGG